MQLTSAGCSRPRLVSHRGSTVFSAGFSTADCPRTGQWSLTCRTTVRCGPNGSPLPHLTIGGVAHLTSTTAVGGKTPRTVTARALAILESFSPDQTALSLMEISRRTGLSASTTHRLVGELSEW